MGRDIEYMFGAGAFGIISGILAFGRYGMPIVLVFLVIFTIALAMWINDQKPKTIIVVAFSLCALIGSARMYFIPEVEIIPSGKLVIEGIISEYPDTRDGTVNYSVCVDQVLDITFDKCILLLVTGELFPRAEFGDRVRASGTIDTPGIIETKDGESFDYGRYLRGEGFSARMSFAKIEILEKHGSSIRTFLFAVRDAFSRGVERALPEPSAGFLKGIILGEKHAIGKDVEDDFKRAGLTHLVVLSGYNVMVVIGMVLFVVRRISVVAAPYIASIVLLAFVVMSGADETAIRAGLMASLMLLGLVLRRQYVAGRALFIVVIGFALFAPLKAISLSFLLSASATFAVIYITPLLTQKLTFVTEKFGIREATSTTIAAQVFVAPLILFNIGFIPALSLIANILVLPIMPITMLFGAIAAFAGMIGFLPMIFSFPAYVLLSYVVWIAEFFGSIPLTFSLPFFSATLTWLAYVFLIRFGFRKSAI